MNVQAPYEQASPASIDAVDTADLLEAMDVALIGYALTDGDGYVLSASPTFGRIAITGAEVTDLPWYELDAATDTEKIGRAGLWQQFRAQNQAWKGWVRWHLPSGRIRYFEGTALPRGNDRVLLLANDRSDRIEADQALQESEETFKVILNDLPVTVILIGPDGVVQYINDYLPRRLGLTADDVIGHHMDEVAATRPDPAFSASLRDAIGNERRVNGVAARLRQGPLAGTDWLFFGRPLYGRDGKMQRYLSVFVDRTAEKRLADERQRFSSALAESQKISALNDFAGSLAHELSNILQPVGIYAGRIAKDPKGENTPEHAAKIDAAVKDARRMLRRTLTMARTEVDAPRAVDIGLTTSEVVESARDLAPAGLSYDLTVEATGEGICQTSELRQVLLNLLNNAAEAQHYAGQIRIHLSGPHPFPKNEPVAPTSAGKFFRIAIRDEGTGMTPAVVSRIFEPFFTTKPAQRGTGLGLPVVLGLVTGWGGTVSVETSPGQGAAFSVWIPVAQSGGPKNQAS